MSDRSFLTERLLLWSPKMKAGLWLASAVIRGRQGTGSAPCRAMTSNNFLAALLFREDRQGIGMLTGMIYDMLKSGQ